MTQPKALPRKTNPPSLLAGFLSYLIPGLGQIYQGRIGKGVMFMVCLLGMFIGGQALGDWQNVYLPRDPNADHNPILRQFPAVVRDLLMRWHYAGQVWVGVAAWPALWQYNNLPVPSAETSPFLHNLQKTPDEDKLNDYLRDRDKMPDLACVYTVIAGILNILVIYDAYAGPAHGGDEEPAK